MAATPADLHASPHETRMPELGAWLGQGGTPSMGSAETAQLLRMYRLADGPRAGALPGDHLDLDGPWHFHDMHQLICAFEGAIELEVQGGRHLIPRQLAGWVPAGVPHRMSVHRVRCVSIFFPKAMVHQPGARPRVVLVSALMREMALEAMRWAISDPEDRLRTLFFGTMAGLCSEWIEREADLFLPVSTDPRLHRALNYTTDRLDAKLPDVCREAGMSERSLRRHLKVATGMTWEAYRQRGRLVRAVAMLSETAASMTEIAAVCGFESPSAFARAFKAAMHETPRAYRDRSGKD